MAVPMIIQRDPNQEAIYSLKPAGNFQQIVLAAGVAKTFTVPSGTADYWNVNFSYSPGATVWVQYSATPTITLPNGTASSLNIELNPGVRTLPAGSTIQLIARDDDTEVGVAYYV